MPPVGGARPDRARLSRRSRAPQQGAAVSRGPPTVEEIIAVMRQTRDDRHGARLRALIVVLWRGGLRVQEALALSERDLDPGRGSLLVRGGRLLVSTFASTRALTVRLGLRLTNAADLISFVTTFGRNSRKVALKNKKLPTPKIRPRNS